MMPRHSRNSRTVNGPGEFRSQGSIPEDQPVDRLFLPEIHILPQPLVAPVQKQHIVTVPCQTSVNQLEKSWVTSVISALPEHKKPQA